MNGSLPLCQLHGGPYFVVQSPQIMGSGIRPLEGYLGDRRKVLT